MSNGCVMLDEVFAAAASRRASVVPETSGYLALAIGDATARLPFAFEDRVVMLSTEGTVTVTRRGEPVTAKQAARGLRDVLARLLAVSAGTMPGLASAARPRDESERGVEAVVQEIEAALIPVNRAAARRALARLARETLKAKESGKLRARPTTQRPPADAPPNAAASADEIVALAADAPPPVAETPRAARANDARARASSEPEADPSRCVPVPAVTTPEPSIVFELAPHAQMASAMTDAEPPVVFELVVDEPRGRATPDRDDDDEETVALHAAARDEQSVLAAQAEPPNAELLSAEPPEVELLSAEPPVAEQGPPELQSAEPPTVHLLSAEPPTVELLQAEPPNAELLSAEPPAVELLSAEPPVAELSADPGPVELPSAEPPLVALLASVPSLAELLLRAPQDAPCDDVVPCESMPVVHEAPMDSRGASAASAPSADDPPEALAEPTPTVLGMAVVEVEGPPPLEYLEQRTEIDAVAMPVSTPLPAPYEAIRRAASARAVTAAMTPPFELRAPEPTRADDLIARFGLSSGDDDGMRAAVVGLKSLAGLDPTPPPIHVHATQDARSPEPPPPPALPAPRSAAEPTVWETSPLPPRTAPRRAGSGLGLSLMVFLAVLVAAGAAVRSNPELLTALQMRFFPAAESSPAAGAPLSPAPVEARPAQAAAAVPVATSQPRTQPSPAASDSARPDPKPPASADAALPSADPPRSDRRAGPRGGRGSGPRSR